MCILWAKEKIFSLSFFAFCWMLKTCLMEQSRIWGGISCFRLPIRSFLFLHLTSHYLLLNLLKSYLNRLEDVTAFRRERCFDSEDRINVREYVSLGFSLNYQFGIKSFLYKNSISTWHSLGKFKPQKFLSRPLKIILLKFLFFSTSLFPVCAEFLSPFIVLCCCLLFPPLIANLSVFCHPYNNNKK